jgi:signal transduction histidine kinase
MSNGVEHHEVAQRMVESMRELFSALTCVLYTIDPATDGALHPLAASGVTRDRIPPHPPGIGAIGLALGRRQVLATADMLADPRIRTTAALREFIRETGHGAVLALPLFAEGRPIGVLAVRGKTGRGWTGEEERLARLFADHATIALENTRLFEESQRRRKTAEALALVARAASQSLDVSVLGQHIVDMLVALVGGVRAAFFGKDASSGRLHLVAVSRREGAGDPPDLIDVTPGPVEMVAARERRLVVTSDFLRELALAGGPAPRSGPSEVPVRAVVATPLLQGDTVIGVLAIHDRPGRVFAPEEVDVFRAAADHAAVGLQNARLHAQVAEVARGRERMRIANELHDTLGQLAFSVGLKLDWCLHRMKATSPLRPKLEAIRRDAGAMMAQIRLLIGHLSAEGPGDAGFARRLESQVEEVRELTGATVNFAIDGDPHRLSPEAQEAVRKALQEAFVNIAKHAQARAVAVRLEIGAECVLEVSDDGVGVPAAPGPVTARPGHHLGLQQMRERFEALGGSLEIAGRPRAGVRIRGRLPLDPAGPSTGGGALGSQG